MRTPIVTAATLFPLVLTACGAREPRLAQEQTPLDDRLTCVHLQAGIVANEFRVAELNAEAERRGRDSVGLILLFGVTGLLFLDDGSTQSAEAQSVQRRNERLRALVAERDCSL